MKPILILIRLAVITSLFHVLPVVEAAPRDDVLVVVNDNSIDSTQLGAYYAQRRDIDPANIVHVSVPDSYFISWSDFRRLRDQLIHFMQVNTLDNTGPAPVVCTDGEPPYYCQAAMDQLRAHTRIRYLVTTRGVPTRMTVDGSTLYAPAGPTSVDNYLKYWLINYFPDDVPLKFTERERAFGDGHGQRMVDPAIDRELIVGRIDGLNLASARALVDRALAAEQQGIYGTWYGSSQFFNWRDANTGAAIYPRTGSRLLGWRYALGLWRENRPECADYLNVSGAFPEGKTPAYCRVQFNDNSNVAAQNTRLPAPGNAASRQPNPVNALGYQGWLDGQKSIGSFNALLNWRKNAQCTVTLCKDAADPEACRAASTDVFRELNTDCVGVADGFVGYNHTSYPVSYLVTWPTGWRGPGNGSGDVNSLAFPEVRTDTGFDDSFSLWFRNTDQVAEPRCYASSDFTSAPDQPCLDTHRVVLTQTIPLAPRTLDAARPQTYKIRFRYQYKDIKAPIGLNVRFLVHDSGAGNAQISYGFKQAVSITGSNTAWQKGEVKFQLDPAMHASTSYDGIEISIETAGAFSGELGIDAVSLQEKAEEKELMINGSFAKGHHQVATGDHAATFLSRLNGVAFWGSVGHHQSGGCAFCFNGLEMLVYFLRGLPLGDAVWFNESNNSGILYGDPLYSPVAVRINPVNSTDTLNGVTDLYGSAVNGRDTAKVWVYYRIDICPGDDFFTCDQTGTWQKTGITGWSWGGIENALLGTLDVTAMDAGDYTLRLTARSTDIAVRRYQVIRDFYTVTIGTDQDGDGIDDAQDNCTSIANPDQRDTDLDGYGNACDADLDNDGLVNLTDVGLFRQVYLKQAAGIEPYTLADHADFNGDMFVGQDELVTLKRLLNTAPGPSCCGVLTP